jgi:predicted nucleotide-binding protein/DNA-binding MarR family transcriptional regulator
MSDAEILAHAGLLLKSSGSNGSVTFSVLPQGIDAYKKGLSMAEGAPDPKKVFVVHGRNEQARKALFDFLRSIGLQPLEWSQALSTSGKGAPFVGEVLDSAFSQVRAVVVLLTGDDLAMLAPGFHEPDDPDAEKRPIPQPRPNVLFEAGMAFGRHPRETILVQLGTLRSFSDIAGRHVVRITNAVASRQDLANRLKAAGCSIELSGFDWHTTGDFDGAIPAQKLAPLSSAWLSPSALDNNELAILKYLRRHEDTEAEDGLNAVEIARTLSMAISTSKHHLDELEDKKLVRVSHFIGRDSEYSIARAGRSLLIQMEEPEHT